MFAYTKLRKLILYNNIVFTDQSQRWGRYHNDHKNTFADQSQRWGCYLYYDYNFFQINHKDEDVREEVISLYQTVTQFKSLLHQWFNVPMQNMKLYYCDQVTQIWISFG